jgi:hypothetical protein
MNDGDIDYSKYTLHELEEVFVGINKHQYPKNYASLCSAYQRLSGAVPPQPESSIAPGEVDEEQRRPKYDENGRYIPNHISGGERASHIFLSLLLFAYGSYGVWINDLFIPGRRSRGVHLQDAPAWTMYGAMICACLVMLSLVIDHYDRRDNERHYRTFAGIGEVLGWSLFGLSMLWAVFQ